MIDNHISIYILRIGASVTVAKRWRHKARLARGHAFEASRDVQFATLDTICSVAFGARVGITTSQEDNLNKLTQLDLPDSLDHVASIPETTLPEAWDALLATVTSGEIAMNSPLGSWHLGENSHARHKNYRSIYPDHISVHADENMPQHSPSNSTLVYVVPLPFATN